jgi:hypothetical protein
MRQLRLSCGFFGREAASSSELKNKSLWMLFM